MLDFPARTGKIGTVLDQYYIVAELQLPAGTLGDWISSVAKNETMSVAELLDTAEGDVLAKVDRNRFSLRALLIDHEFFAVLKLMEPAFLRAAKLGATGQWYAGDHFSGTVSTLRGGGKVDAKKIKNAPEPIKGWITEAYDYSALCMQGKAPPRTRLGSEPKSAKLAAPTKKSVVKKSGPKSRARKPKR